MAVVDADLSVKPRRQPASDAESVERYRTAAVLALVAIVAILVASRPLLLSLSTDELSALATAVGLASMVAVVATTRRGFWSVPGVCLMILMVFHLGALPELITGGRSSLRGTNTWIFTTTGSL